MENLAQLMNISEADFNFESLFCIDFGGNHQRHTENRREFLELTKDLFDQWSIPFMFANYIFYDLRLFYRFYE